jgi:hypothetical protein
MTPKTITFVAAGVICAGTLVVAWREARSRRADETALVAMTGRRAGLEAQITRAQERNASLERDRKALKAALDDLSAPRKQPTPAFKPVQLTDPAQAALGAMVAYTPWQDIVLAKNPGLQAKYLKSERTKLAATYGPLWQALGLTSEQTEKFKDIMTDNAGKLLDLKSITQEQGLTESDTAYATLQQQATDQLRAAQVDLLGEAGFRQLQQYERTLPVRSEINTLAGALALTDAPLGDQQAEQLTQIMANASSGYQNGGKADTPVSVNLAIFTSLIRDHKMAEDGIDWSAVRAQARSVLSDAQFALFDAYITKDQSVVRLYNLIQQSSGDPMAGFVFGRR